MCSVQGCDQPNRARDMCVRHYRRWHRHGDPTVVKPAGRPRQVSRTRDTAQHHRVSETSARRLLAAEDEIRAAAAQVTPVPDREQDVAEAYAAMWRQRVARRDGRPHVSKFARLVRAHLGTDEGRQAERERWRALHERHPEWFASRDEFRREVTAGMVFAAIRYAAKRP